MDNNLTFMRQVTGKHDRPVPATRLYGYGISSDSDGLFIVGPAITKLAAYEALGMEPHDVEEMIQECKAEHATKMLECEICGTKFEPTKERHYTVIENTNMFTKEVYLGDAFDCPKCGRQIVTGRRCVEYKEEENA